MFDFIRNNTRLMGFMLALLIVPAFVLVGVDGYRKFDRGESVASVAGQSITREEWDATHRSTVDRMRAQQPTLDVKAFDSEEARYATLENLVRERVLQAAAQKDRLLTSNQRLAAELQRDQVIASLRKPDGSIDVSRYEQLLAGQGMSPAAYEASIRAKLSADQVLGGVSGSGLVVSAAAKASLDAFFERRQVQWTRFETVKQLPKVQLTDADLTAYYEKNQEQFKQPEQVDVEYVVLDLPAVVAGLKLSDVDLHAYYDQNAPIYSTAEERRASHILINAPKTASAADREAAKAKAQELLQQAKQSPGKFADLAKKHSQDPGSAAQGGDLSFFRRGAMVKPFEDAAFALKKGDVSDLVETDFGFHVIQLTDIKPSVVRPFDSVKAEISELLKKQRAQREFAEKAELFGNLVYEQAETFQPVVDKLKVAVQSAKGLGRSPIPGAKGVLANPKFLEAVFAGEAVSKKRNSEALEMGPNQLVSVRVTQHQPAQVLPLEQVKVAVRTALLNERAAEMAQAEGEKALAQWKTDGAKLAASAVVSRNKPEGLTPSELSAALSADASKDAAWVGVKQGPTGYTVLKVEKVLPRTSPTPEVAKQENQQYEQWWASAEAQAYYLALQKRFKVDIKVKRPAMGRPVV